MTDCSSLWPPQGVRTDLYLEYLAGEVLKKFALGTELMRPLLIGIRGVAPGMAEPHDLLHKVAYDDTAVFVSPAEMPFVFPCATHAYQLDSRESPDVNGDGRGDVASIDPGLYKLEARGTATFPIFILTLPNGDGRIPCLRDANHDYKPETPGTATAVLFHTGYDAPLGSEHRSSIACQTCSAQYLRMMAAASHVFGGKIDYALVTADDAVAMNAGNPFRTILDMGAADAQTPRA